MMRFRSPRYDVRGRRTRWKISHARDGVGGNQVFPLALLAELPLGLRFGRLFLAFGLRRLLFWFRCLLHCVWIKPTRNVCGTRDLAPLLVIDLFIFFS